MGCEEVVWEGWGKFSVAGGGRPGDRRRRGGWRLGSGFGAWAGVGGCVGCASVCALAAACRFSWWRPVGARRAGGRQCKPGPGYGCGAGERQRRRQTWCLTGRDLLRFWTKHHGWQRVLTRAMPRLYVPFFTLEATQVDADHRIGVGRQGSTVHKRQGDVGLHSHVV